jgi:hypothetical protein
MDQFFRLQSLFVSQPPSCHWTTLTPLVAFSFSLDAHRKDLKKVHKLESQIPYHEGRGNMDEANKIREQVASIWEKAKQDSFA